MSKNPRDIIFKPVISEKSYDLIEDHNTYTFLVDPRANKTEVKEAVKSIFGVSVERVNIQNRRGKRKRTGWVVGRTASSKRALVTLAPGDTIDIFGV